MEREKRSLSRVIIENSDLQSGTMVRFGKLGSLRVKIVKKGNFLYKKVLFSRKVAALVAWALIAIRVCDLRK